MDNDIWRGEMKKEKNDMPLSHKDDSRDYLSFDSLLARAGVDDKHLIKLAVKELVDNALDHSEKCDIGMIDENGFFIQDYGKGIELNDEDIAYLFSIVRKTYTTKGSRLVTRGAFGKGLRVVVGMVFCHDATLYVSTCGRKLLLAPHEEGTSCKREGIYSGEGTRIEIIFKESISEQDLEWGELVIKMSQGNNYGHSSPWWYDSLSFYNLLKGLSYNRKSIKKSLSGIFGNFSEKKIKEDLRPLLKTSTAEKMTRLEAGELLAELQRVMTKKIQPKALGCVGDLKGFHYYRKQYGKYIDKVKNEKVEIPFVLELWAKPVQVGSSESKNSEVVVFVNKSPLAKDNSTIWDLSKKSYFYIKTPDEILCEFNELKAITIFYLNIITPYLPRTGEAKLPNIPDRIRNDIQEMFNILVKKINRDFNPAKKAPKNTNIRSVTMNQNTQRIMKENKVRIDNFLNEEGVEEKDKKNSIELMDDDLFSVGLTEASVDKALWFKDVWNSYNSEGKRIHLRRLHYRLVSSSEKIKRYNGEDYINDRNSWNYLLQTAKHARALEMVDPLQIADQRNPEPYGIFDPYFHLSTKVALSPWRMPEIALSRFQLERFDMPSLDIDEALAGAYASSLQPVHLEIWVEKSTMNDILEEICTYYGIILVQSAGYSSITGIEHYFQQRALLQNKPSIIYYISDYDGHGQNMPVQVARTIQHCIYRMKANGSFPEGKEIIIQPIILTAEQMESEEFKDLPKVPVGKGHSTELDALEAVMPGKFKEIVEENIQKVLNVNIISEMPSYFNDAKHKFKKTLHSVTGEMESEISTLRSNLDKVTEKYKSQLQDLSEKIMKDYAPHKKRIMEIEDEIIKYATEKAQNVSIDIEIPTIPQLENPFFNSSRRFGEQTKILDEYRTLKKRQPKK